MSIADHSVQQYLIAVSELHQEEKIVESLSVLITLQSTYDEGVLIPFLLQG